MSCRFDPAIYVNVPLGMFHCPECGDMVLAGLPHPPSMAMLDFGENVASFSALCGWAIHGFEVRREKRWRIG